MGAPEAPLIPVEENAKSVLSNRCEQEIIALSEVKRGGIWDSWGVGCSFLHLFIDCISHVVELEEKPWV